MVLVEVDGNYIDAEPMKSKSEGEMIKTYLTLWTRLTRTGSVKPTTHIMDNEASEEYKKKFEKIALFNSYLQTTTEEIWPNGRSKPSKIISKQSWLEWMTLSQ